jgi:hypothetical protein
LAAARQSSGQARPEFLSRTTEHKENSMRSRLLIVLTALAVGATLTGCGKESSTAADAAKKAAAEAADKAKEAAAKAGEAAKEATKEAVTATTDATKDAAAKAVEAAKEAAAPKK